MKLERYGIRCWLPSPAFAVYRSSDFATLLVREAALRAGCARTDRSQNILLDWGQFDPKTDIAFD